MPRSNGMGEGGRGGGGGYVGVNYWNNDHDKRQKIFLAAITANQ